MKVDILLVPFDAGWPDMQRAARWAEDVGFDGVWTWDHLSGRAYGARHSLEAWTVISALAAVTSRISVGPMVLNVANRDPGSLAVMAATLHHVSSGRLILGLGAGPGPRNIFSQEQSSLNRSVPHDQKRRDNLKDAVARIRATWSLGDGFLEPLPHPGIVLGVHGYKMAALAAEIADGMDIESHVPEPLKLIDFARSRRPDHKRFSISTRIRIGDDIRDSAATVARWSEASIDRIILHLYPPFTSQFAGALAAMELIRSSMR